MENIKALHKKLKEQRDFDVDSYILRKAEAINDFFKENNLSAAVVGISGGVDSAVVYRLLSVAATLEDSPIKYIEGIMMPIYCHGTSGQKEATSRGMELVLSDPNFNEKKCYYQVDDLTNACFAYIENIDEDNCTPWTIGQLASIVRTPNLYFRAAVLQTQGLNSIVVGTTNRDEGSYIGFFGKASDAMNDLQPIADIHKSEVYEIAKKLNVPESIINEKPRGDVWDNKVDEEMIGAPYWFLEFYILFATLLSIEEIKNFIKSIDNKEELEIIEKYSGAINELNAKNIHKYKITEDSFEPLGFAKYVDVMPRIFKQRLN